MKNYPTPHIDAVPQDFAETVLMPGDPLRAEFIAKEFFDSPRLVNCVRGINGYTGYYKGKLISVMASGMGMPSMGIYSYELFNIFGVNNIIRVGSAGALTDKVKVRDIVIAAGASTDSSYGKQFGLPGIFSPIASYSLLKTAASVCERKKASFHVGSVLSSDLFYSDSAGQALLWGKMGVMCVEMETAALYMNAARSEKNALSILTISDSLVTGEATTSHERQTTFLDMIDVALETALNL